MAKDRLKGRDIAGRLEKPAGEGVPQVMAPERHSSAAGDHGKDVGERRVSLTVIMPE